MYTKEFEQWWNAAPLPAGFAYKALVWEAWRTGREKLMLELQYQTRSPHEFRKESPCISTH